MSSSINLNLTGVGDQIAATVAEAMRKQQAASESAALVGKEIGREIGTEIAKQIGKEFSEHVAAAFKIALADLQKPTFDLREQILSNAHAILASHRGDHDFEDGITVVVADYGDYVSASVVSASASRMPDLRNPTLILLSGMRALSGTEALQGLLEGSSRALARAWKLRDSKNGFRDLRDLYSNGGRL